MSVNFDPKTFFKPSQEVQEFSKRMSTAVTSSVKPDTFKKSAEMIGTNLPRAIKSKNIFNNFASLLQKGLSAIKNFKLHG